MGKNKISRWNELATFGNVIQPDQASVPGTSHPLKGNWKKDFFGNNNPVVLELACGKGEYTTSLSEIYQERNFIGIDIKGARMWRGARTTSEKNIRNAAFLRTRIEFLDSYFAEDEVDEIWVVFPDPHPGKRNSNKRLTCPWFLNKYRNVMRDKGIIHLKTDNTELYRYTRRIAEANNLQILASTEDLYSSFTSGDHVFSDLYGSGYDRETGKSLTIRVMSVRTHYEKLFLVEGRNINYLAFRLDKNKVIAGNYERKTP